MSPPHPSLQSETTSDYLVLIAILLAGFFGFLTADSRHLVQLTWIVATSAGYVLWGTIHHLRSGDFHWEVLFEYLLMAALAVGLVATLIFS
jgi:hypothetical protein